jgi:hypothetical protein
MSPEEQFWWNWWVQVATAVGTMGAVVIALFGDWVRLRLLSPKLRIRLRSAESDELPNTGLFNPNDPSGSPFLTRSRWYHVTVTNARRWVEAKDVQVFLVRVEEPDEAGEFTTIWSGASPLKWRHMQSLNPAATRTVGHDAEADLVALFRDAATSKEPFLQLQPMSIPVLLNPHRVGRCKLRTVLRARERQVESNHLTVEISWDGKWPEGHEKTPRGIVVREVASF